MQQINAESPTRKSLTTFIARVMLSLGDSVGGLKLNIRDPGEYGAKGLLHEYGVSAEKKADQLALEIEHDAQEEADGAGRGPHHFELYAYHNQTSNPFSSKRFIVVSENAPEETDRDADGRSLLSQTQRHLEAMAKINAQKDQMVMHSMATVVHGLTERLNAYDTNALQQQQLSHQNTLDRAKIDFDLETRKFLIEMARMAASVGMPIVIPKLVQKMMAEEEAEKEEAIDVQQIVSEPRAPEPKRIAAPVVTPSPESSPNGHSKTKKNKRARA